ncbi:MAG: hypothetical protein N2A40_04165 [Desulfobulbaceae bacterium]
MLISQVVNWLEILKTHIPGDEKETFSFPDDLTITDGSVDIKLTDLKVDKLIALVSDACPVSMIEAVTKARQLARQKVGVQLIIAPLEKLPPLIILP